MRTTIPARRLTRWGATLAATGLLSLGGVWVSAQDAGGPAQALPAAPDRERVPTVAELQAQLTRLRRDTLVTAGGPALEHAALALGRARQAEAERDAGSAGAPEAALQARRIALAALTLVEAQRDRERARLLRDEAAQARHAAEGAARTAEEALRVARINAAAAATEPAASPPVATPPAAPASLGAPAPEAPAPGAAEEVP